MSKRGKNENKLYIKAINNIKITLYRGVNRTSTAHVDIHATLTHD